MTAVELTMDDVWRDKDAVHEWLRAHDLDPMETAPGVRVEDGEVTAVLYESHPDGSKVVLRDEYTGEVLGAKTTTVVRALRAPLPAGLGTAIA